MPLIPLKPAVYIIGAGPGDPDLLTMKAYKIISQADIILYADSLVPKQILQNSRPDAQLIPTGNKTLEEIIPLMIDWVKTTVRLFVFIQGTLPFIVLFMNKCRHLVRLIFLLN